MLHPLFTAPSSRPARLRPIVAIAILLMIVVALFPATRPLPIHFAEPLPVELAQQASAGSLLPADLLDLPEVSAYRDEFTRHFRLGDGRYVAVVSPTPLSYRDARGHWQPIDTRFSAADGGYAVDRNSLRSFLGPQSSALHLEHGSVALAWRPLALQAGSTGALAQQLATPLPPHEAAAATLVDNGNTLRYGQAWSAPQIVEQFHSRPGGIKQELVLNAPPLAPAGAEWLELKAELSFPPGTLIFAEGAQQPGDFSTSGPIELRTASGALLLMLDPPQAYEQADPTQAVAGRYQASRGQAGLTLLVQTPWSWWKAPGRSYPAVLDPTMHVLRASDQATFTHQRSFESGDGGAPISGETRSAKSGVCVGHYDVSQGDDVNVRGYERGYVRFALPTLPNGSVAQSAQVVIAAGQGGGDGTFEKYADRTTRMPTYLLKNSADWRDELLVNPPNTAAFPAPDPAKDLARLKVIKKPDSALPAEGKPLPVTIWDATADVLGWYADPASNFGYTLRAYTEDIDLNANPGDDNYAPGYPDFSEAYSFLLLPELGVPTYFPTFTCLPTAPQWSLDNVVANLATPQSATTDAAGIGMLITYSAPSLPVEGTLDGVTVPSALPLETYRYQYHEYALPAAQAGATWRLVAAQGRSPASDGLSPYVPLTLVTPDGQIKTTSDAGKADPVNAAYEHQPSLIAVGANQGNLNLRVEVDNQPTDNHASKLYVLQTADVQLAPNLAPTADINKLQATVPITIFRELARGRELSFMPDSVVEIKVPYPAGITKANAAQFDLLLFAPGLPYGSRSDGAAARLTPGPNAYEIEFPVPVGTSGPYLLALQSNQERDTINMQATITLCKNSSDVVRYPLDGQCVELQRPPASVIDNTAGNEPAGVYLDLGSGASRVRAYSPAGFSGNCAVNCTSNPTLAGVPVMPMVGYGDDGNKWVTLKSGQITISGGALSTTTDARLLLVDFSDPTTIGSLPVLRGQFSMNAANGTLAATSLPADTYLLVSSPLHVSDDNGGQGDKNGWAYTIDFPTDQLVAKGALARQIQPTVGGGVTSFGFKAQWSIGASGGPSLQGQIGDLLILSPSATFDVGSLKVTAPGNGSYSLERGAAINGALPSSTPPFQFVRMVGATLAQGDAVGGAKVPVPGVLLPPGKQVKDEQGFQPSLQCGTACFDLRGPTDTTSPAGQVVDRKYRMPDMIIQENAGTITLQDASGVSIFSKDHPKAMPQEENSTSFSYEAFEAEVETFKGPCPPLIDPLTGGTIGSEETTTVVLGKAIMSLPNANGDTGADAGGSKIEVNFTFCSGALRDMGFTFDTGDQTAIPIGSTGLYMHVIGGQISLRPEAPGSPVIIVIKIKLRGMNQGTDGSTVFIAGKITIDTRGLFDLQLHAGLTVSGVGLGVDGHFWVAWAPLDLGFEVQACIPRTIKPADLGFDADVCDESELLFGSLKMHLWQGQGWQNQYSWLPDDDTLHFTASFKARIKLSAGMIVDEGLFVLPPSDIELVGIRLAFGEFCINDACTTYEWGVLASFSVLGFDVGAYYGFDTGMSFFTGTDDYVLIDEAGGQAALNAARPAQAAQQIITIGPDTPSAIFSLAWSSGQPAPTFTLKEPGPGGRTLSALSMFADVKVTTTPTSKGQQTIIAVTGPKAGDWVIDIAPQNTTTRYQFFYGSSKAAPKLALASLPGGVVLSSNPTLALSWTASNVPASGAWVSLYYSRTLTHQLGGKTVSQPIVGPIVEHLPLKASDNYTWDISGLSEGSYQVFAHIETNAALLINACGNQPYNPKLSSPGACDTLFNAAFVVPPKDNEFLAPNSFSYRDFTPPAQPTGVKARTEGLTSLAVSWKPNGEKDLSGYVVTCEQGALKRKVRVTATMPVTSALSETARVNGLNGGELASCSVRAYDYSDNLSDPSAAAQATPSNAIPAPPAQVMQISINPNFNSLLKKIKLSWPAAQGAQGYLVYYSPVFSPTGGLAAQQSVTTMQVAGMQLRTGSFRAEEGRSPLLVDGASELDLTGLVPNMPYKVQVRAYDADGRLGQASEPVVFTTPPALSGLWLPLIWR